MRSRPSTRILTDQSRAERLDVNVAGAQLDSFLEHVIDGANNGRSAGKVAKALDVVVTGNPRSHRFRVQRDVFVNEALVEGRFDIFERCDADTDVFTEHDRGCANGGRIAGIGDASIADPSGER